MARKHKHKGPHVPASRGGALTPPPVGAGGMDNDGDMDQAPMPGRNTFSAAEEQAMRGGGARSGSAGLPPGPGGMDNDGDMD